MEKTTPHFASSQNVHIDEAYVSWLEELKGRYQKAQIKSAVKVNSEQLLFNWQLGRDLVVRRAEEHWGAGVVEQVRGRRSFTSFIMSSLAFSTNFSKYFASIGKVFCYFYLHFKEMLYLCKIPIRSYRLSRLEVWGFFIFPSMNKIAHSLFEPRLKSRIS